MTIDDNIRHEKLQYVISREAAKISASSSEKNDEYEYLTVKKYHHLIKAKKQNKKSLHVLLTIEEQENKIDAITSQSKKLEALTNIDDDQNEIFNGPVKEIFYKIIKLTNEISQNDFIYYLKGSSTRKRFDDCNNGTKPFGKIRSGEMKLESAKKLQKMFKRNLNKILKVRYKSEEKENVLKNIKLLYKSQEAAIKLFNDCSSVMFEAKYKTKYGENLKILTPKQIL